MTVVVETLTGMVDVKMPPVESVDVKTLSSMVDVKIVPSGPIGMTTMVVATSETSVVLVTVVVIDCAVVVTVTLSTGSTQTAGTGVSKQKVRLPGRMATPRSMYKHWSANKPSRAFTSTLETLQAALRLEMSAIMPRSTPSNRYPKEPQAASAFELVTPPVMMWMPLVVLVHSSKSLKMLGCKS